MPLRRPGPGALGIDADESTEVLAVFAVEASGRADTSTWRMPRGTAPEVVEAMRSYLADTRFYPALRAGEHVRQLAVWRIVPDPEDDRPAVVDGQVVACLPFSNRATVTASLQGQPPPAGRDRFLQDLVHELVQRAEVTDDAPLGRITIGFGGPAPPSFVLEMINANAEQQVWLYRWVRDAMRSVTPPDAGNAFVHLELRWNCET